MGLTGGESKKLFVVNVATAEEKDRKIPAYGRFWVMEGPLNDMVYDPVKMRVFVTSNDGCVYKLYLDRVSENPDGDYEGPDGIQEFDEDNPIGEGEDDEEMNERQPKVRTNEVGKVGTSEVGKAGKGEVGKVGTSKVEPAKTDAGKNGAGTGKTGSDNNTKQPIGNQDGGNSSSKQTKKYEDSRANNQEY